MSGRVYKVHTEGAIDLWPTPRVSTEPLARLNPGHFLARLDELDREGWWWVYSDLRTHAVAGYVRSGDIIPVRSAHGLIDTVEEDHDIEDVVPLNEAPLPVRVSPVAGSSNWQAEIAGETLSIGREQSFPGGDGRRYRGLMLVSPNDAKRYERDDWRGEYGVWADMLAVTCLAEGEGDLTALNTYDGSGVFTFGLMQWAAHTANDNLVELLRRLLALPSAPRYFPDLTVAEGRIHQIQHDGTLKLLENDDRNSALGVYLNPSLFDVDEDEAVAAARLIHWVRNDTAAESTLVRYAFDHYKTTAKSVHKGIVRNGYARGLDGHRDIEVALCVDIRHQGRGRYSSMGEALQSANPVGELLKVRTAEWQQGRIDTVSRLSSRFESEGRLGGHIFDAETERMVIRARREDRPPPSPIAPAEVVIWPEAHITSRWAKRANKNSAAHRLAETGGPVRDPAASKDERVTSLKAIADWLAPEESPRYLKPPNARTRCNIYAHDFAELAGGYIPRTWWNEEGLAAIRSGETVNPIYDRTVVELTANMLHDWFEQFGAAFGWREVADLDTLQADANDGKLCTIVALRKDRRRSGHIAIVMPEGLAGPLEVPIMAARSVSGKVAVPVQSQAGAKNFRLGLGSATPWWQSSQMARHGFWVRD